MVALPGLSTLQVIDRDEARFAQASVQMAESGDLINIRFQDEARNKKPAGIYWMQTAALTALSDNDERKIWVQRLPSVLGALLCALMTFWAARKLIGRDGAFIAAALVAVSTLMIFEAHIAKTDAVLAGLAACLFAAIAGLRHSGKNADPSKGFVWLFWTAMGLAVLIKGPVLPALAGLTLITLFIWERDGRWMRRLANPLAIIVFLLLVVPWAITIWIATDGAFFAESLGKDFGGKLLSAQEKHGGLPGYHLAAIWLTFWPGCLLLLPGLAFAVRAVRNAPARGSRGRNRIARAMRLCLCWILPFWLMIELMPTKLPHYALPLFPAIATLCGAAAMTMINIKEFPVTRRINAVLFILISAIFVAVIVLAPTLYSSAGSFNPVMLYGLAGSGGLLAIAAGFALWMNKANFAVISAILTTLILSVPVYGFIMPGLTQLRVADNIEIALRQNGIALPRHGGPEILSPHFTEPSLVYRLGTDIKLGETANALDMEAVQAGRVILIDMKNKKGPVLQNALTAKALETGICLETVHTVEGFNYSKGDPVTIRMIRKGECEARDMLPP